MPGHTHYCFQTRPRFPTPFFSTKETILYSQILDLYTAWSNVGIEVLALRQVISNNLSWNAQTTAGVSRYRYFGFIKRNIDIEVPKSPGNGLLNPWINGIVVPNRATFEYSYSVSFVRRKSTNRAIMLKSS